MCRYALGTSKVCTSIPSWASIINDAKSASSTMVGNIASSRGVQLRWGLPYTHLLPLMLPHHLSLMIFTSWGDIYCSCWDMSAGSCSPKTGRLCNCLYLFRIATTSLLPYILMTFFPHLGETCFDCCPIVFIGRLLFLWLSNLEKLYFSISVVSFSSYSWF